MALLSQWETLDSTENSECKLYREIGGTSEKGWSSFIFHMGSLPSLNMAGR